jgi:predicted DNA-binding protein
MSGRPKKEKTKTIYIRLSDNLDKRLRDDAHKEGRELSGMVRLIIESYYEKQRKS